MFRSSLTITLLAAGISVITLLNQLLLARYFGAGRETDGYLIAISQPTTLIGVLAGILSYQLVPALLTAAKNNGTHKLMLRSVTGTLGSAALIIAVLGGVLAELTTSATGAGLSTGELQTVVTITRISWCWVPLAVIGAIYTAGLHVERRFAAATISASFPIIGSTVGCLVGQLRWGIAAIAVGQLFGYALMVVVLRARVGRLGGGFDWESVRDLCRRMPVAGLALLIFVLYPVADAFWGPRIGPSAVSFLGYAQRLVVGLGTLGVVGASTVLFPRLAEHAAAGEHEAFKTALGRSLRIVIGIMAPTAAIVSVLALPIVRTLFLRGAFGEKEATALADLLPWMCAGMVAMSGMAIAFKALFAQGWHGRAAGISIGGSLLYFVLSGIGSKAFGLNGVGAAYLFSWWIVFFAAVRTLDVLQHDWRYVRNLLLTVGVCTAVAWAGRTMVLTEVHTRLYTVVALAGITFTSAAVFCAASIFWPGLEEMRLLIARYRKKSG